MGSVLVRAANTGIGFITHEDRLKFTLNGIGNDVYEVSGDYQEWMNRVGGVFLSQAEINAIDALAKIVALERQVTERRYREAILTESGRAWLESKNAEIAALRASIA